jgi:hypothetical protein
MLGLPQRQLAASKLPLAVLLRLAPHAAVAARLQPRTVPCQPAAAAVTCHAQQLLCWTGCLPGLLLQHPHVKLYGLHPPAPSKSLLAFKHVRSRLGFQLSLPAAAGPIA